MGRLRPVLEQHECFSLSPLSKADENDIVEKLERALELEANERDVACNASFIFGFNDVAHALEQQTCLAVVFFSCSYQALGRLILFAQLTDVPHVVISCPEDDASRSLLARRSPIGVKRNPNHSEVVETLCQHVRLHTNKSCTSIARVGVGIQHEIALPLPRVSSIALPAEKRNSKVKPPRAVRRQQRRRQRQQQRSQMKTPPTGDRKKPITSNNNLAANRSL